MSKIAVIGAGPAGLYATRLLESFSGEVHLFDQNGDVGEKLKLTGGGRMNVTNQKFSEAEFSSCSQNLLKKIFKNPHVAHREAIFAKLGVEYQWEGARAILKSQSAPEEVARLKQAVLEQSNAQLHLRHQATGITRVEAGYRVEFLASGRPTVREFSQVILAGGAMYRLKDMGAVEHIYALPIQLGHHITSVSPSLSPLVFKDVALRELKGLSFHGRLTDKGKNVSVVDDMIITHFGLSGPAVLDFSALRVSEQIELCFTTALTEDALQQKLNELRQGKHRVRLVLREFLPNRLVDFLLTQAQIDLESSLADLPKAKLQALLQLIYHYPIPHCQSKNYPSSWTTKGGVDLTEVQSATLESKLAPGVFFVGEILDLNGLCGGYNISWAAISAQIVADKLLK